MNSEGYNLYYTPGDAVDLADYKILIENGIDVTSQFFKSSFPKEFDIYFHPSRSSLEKAWQIDWNMPNFTSQCWMVASGVSTKLDMIAPKRWDSLACEHQYSDLVATQNLITHELVHVFHGQHNASPDFSDVSGIDWFVEGLAVYVSGQCDSTRISEVIEAVKRNSIPQTLDQFWTGNLKYGLSGTVVMYLDQKYGQDQLRGVIQHNHIDHLLSDLSTTSEEILNGWKTWIINQ